MDKHEQLVNWFKNEVDKTTTLLFVAYEQRNPANIIRICGQPGQTLRAALKEFKNLEREEQEGKVKIPPEIAVFDGLLDRISLLTGELMCLVLRDQLSPEEQARLDEVCCGFRECFVQLDYFNPAG